MQTIHVMTDLFCQVDIHFDYKKYLHKWLAILTYFFTPEDMRDAVYREPVSAHPEYVTKHMEHAKTTFWFGMAIVVALLLSRLQ